MEHEAKALLDLRLSGGEFVKRSVVMIGMRVDNTTLHVVSEYPGSAAESEYSPIIKEKKDSRGK